jgi:hypothetical protein
LRHLQYGLGYFSNCYHHDINGDGLPDRVFDVNPSDNQPGLYVFLNTGNGFDSGKETLFIVTWISVKHSIG